MSQVDLGRFLKRGDRIVWGQACGEPTVLVEALIAQAEGIGDLSAFAATSFSGLLTAEAGGRVAISSMGAIGRLRELSADGRLGIVPCHVSQIGSFIEQGLIGCDVAFVQVSPADADGNHSFGLIHDFVATAVAQARVVIAEVNARVPRTHGSAVLPAARIAHAVHTDRSPVEVAPARIGDTDAAIARVVAGYIEDGAILQVGIGAVPDAILRLLRDRRDLGVHSGMIGDSVVELVEAGVVTNALKPVDAGLSVANALIGTRRLYDWADDNAALAMRPSAYTNDHAVLAALPRLVSINAAIEVDLFGQVNAEQSGSAYLGGTGGQVDFVRGAVRSSGGRAIVALSATAKSGTISKIVPALAGPVTTARSDVDVIVTEYGAAELRGRTLAERARRMVAIAHPDFRDTLDRAAFEIARRGY